MKLSKDKLEELTHGAERIIEENGRISFCRFTEEQQNLYKNLRNESLYLKTFTPAGIKLEFITNSKSLFLKVNVPFVTTRSYFAIDVCVNGKIIGSVNNYDGMDMTGCYAKNNCPTGIFENSFDLGNGEKTVTLFLPWSVPVELEELSVDDYSYVNPVKRDKKLLVFGDSITQGYDVLNPSTHYIPVLSDILKADVYNKAIGGEIFFPELADTSEDFIPDYIIVSYGSNDWSRSTADEFKRNCKEFYTILSRKYPDSKIFALTLIWRKDYTKTNNCGEFSFIDDYIKSVAEELLNVHCVCGFDFVPHDENLFADLILHPNDKGFEYFADNLYKSIKDII